MAKKLNYAAMFTLRKDGLYMGYWRDLDRDGQPTGKRHAIYDKDPERLYNKIQEKQTPMRRTFKDIADEWETIHREEVSDRTWKNYKPHFEAIVEQYGTMPITDITAYDVSQDLLVAKAKGYSHTIVNSRRSIWRGIFDYAISQREMPYNPAASVKLPKGLKKGKRKAPEEEIITTIISNATDMKFGFIPFFLLCTGVRRSEALQRKKSDIDIEKWVLTIPRAKTEAGVRTVPIIAPLRDPLIAWMEAHPGQWLFPRIEYYAGRKGRVGYMTDTNWETAWGKYCTANGWVDEDGKPTIGAHNLRHGTATLLYEAEVDVYTMRDVLGHANINTTLEIYTELRKKYEDKKVGKFARSMAKKKDAVQKKKERSAS